MIDQRESEAGENTVDGLERDPQLGRLRALLKKLVDRPLMGELATALTKMLDAGQIKFETVRRGKTVEKAFMANVTPLQMAELLPLVTHPATYSTFRLLLERLVCIQALDGHEDEIQFGNTEEFVTTSDPSRIVRSGIGDPPSMHRAMARAVSERALAEALGLPDQPTTDGWLRLYIGDQSVGVHTIGNRYAGVTYPSPDDISTDIIVVTFPDDVTETVYIIGWTSREAFRKKHRRVAGTGGAARCALPQSKLFPFERLLKLAAQHPARGLQ